ncbi:MAG: mobile mystery protein B [Chitinophagaceae bacterium]|nr:MAG: mobile mystery protein B [Chitinophagaceae bacterium]
MGLDLVYGKGQTPLSDEEKDGLKMRHIISQGELNEMEQMNIQLAVEWTLGLETDPGLMLTEKFIRDLHKKMYGDVWKWAGEFRKTDKNIGVDWKQIPVAVRTLLDDCRFWIKENVFPPDEIAIRFKHRIVSIHCFPNGNGRHSRLMADLIASRMFKTTVFGWGIKSYTDMKTAREQYISALRKSDRQEPEALIAFARS